jgi:dynein intermediate chain, cytosolic
MAEDGTRTQRASALEEKKRRLDDLKKRREQRGGDSSAHRAANASSTANLDEYIDGLLGEQQPTAVPPPHKQNDNATSDTVASSGASAAQMNGDAKSVLSAASNVFSESAPAPPVKMVETFTIGTQTEIEDIEDLQDEDPLDLEDAAAAEPKAEVDASEANAALVAKNKNAEPKVLTSEEVMKTVSSKPFSSFINTASKKVERVLGAPILSDLLIDYVGATDGGAKSSAEAKDTNSKYVQSQQTYECAKWTENRDVTDIDWSPLHRELILTTYHMPSSRAGGPARGETAVSAISAHDTLSSSVTPRSSELQSDGLALIWSLAMPHRPEHIFTCGSPVTSGRFHPTDPTLIIGGCESGQLVVWDIRSGRLPVQKSALSTVAGANAKGHTHPIAQMEIIEGGVSANDMWHFSCISQNLIVRPCYSFWRRSNELLVAI